jgi:hypothetical protein
MGLKESLIKAVDKQLINDLIIESGLLSKAVEWVGESGYVYDGFKYWVRKYQTPITYHHTWEEDYLSTEQLLNKMLNELK